MSNVPDMELPRAVTEITYALSAAGHHVVLVGGAVRDALLGHVSPDFDLATDASTEHVRSALKTVPGLRGVYAIGERFGTVGVALDDGAILEITTMRGEAETLEGRFSADASLRDFTVNAMGVDLASGDFLDPLNGRADLDSCLLRAPGRAFERFEDDPIRVVRAARFVAQFGFRIDPATAAAMEAVAPKVADVSVERVRDELTKLLLAPHVGMGLTTLHESGALAVVLPEVAALDGVTQPSFHDLDVLSHTIQTVVAAPETRVLRWAALLHDVGKAPARTIDPDGRIRFLGHAEKGAEIAEAITKRLRFSNADTAAVAHLVAEHMRLGALEDASARAVDRAVRKLDLWERGTQIGAPLVSAEDALGLSVADFLATAHRDEATRFRDQLTAVIAESRARGTHVELRSPVSGEELMATFGIEEGPAVGLATSAILAALEHGTIAADDREGALEIARRALADNA